MTNRFAIKTLVSSLLTVSFASTGFANQMSVRLGKDVDGFNVAFISVTVCRPGTRECKTIDRIKLDTGSEGLRINKSALEGLDLPIEKDSSGNELAMCAGFGGGEHLWGPIATANLKLGDESLRGVKLQIVDPAFTNVAGCPPQEGGDKNGIIGIDTAINSINGKAYFACTTGKCMQVTLKTSQQPLNPIAYLSRDNNGFVMSTPPVPDVGVLDATGTVFFGIGTRANNRPPAKTIACHVRADDFFQLKYQGQTYWTKFDSGTNSYDLPPAIRTEPFCQGSSVYLCPPQPVTVPLELLNADGSTCTDLSVGVDADINGPYTTHNSWVLPDLGETWGGGTSSSFILGLPFFFGKNIFYGLAGKTSPLGAGPIVAY